MDPENRDRAQVTRRTLLRGAAIAASAVPVLLAGVSAAHAKASQKAVGYQNTPKGEQSCANCRVFEPPSSCKTVEGTVSPNGWCKIYVKK
jgi:hypothetical protein